jgi:hypothetical protein
VVFGLFNGASPLPEVGGTRLFRTADFPDGPGLFDRLGRAGIFVRRFEFVTPRARVSGCCGFRPF